METSSTAIGCSLPRLRIRTSNVLRRGDLFPDWGVPVPRYLERDAGGSALEDLDRRLGDLHRGYALPPSGTYRPSPCRMAPTHLGAVGLTVMWHPQGGAAVGAGSAAPRRALPSGRGVWVRGGGQWGPPHRAVAVTDGQR